MIRWKGEEIKPYQHVTVSLIIGAAVYLYFKSLACGVASFLAGVFLDIDHLFDCYINYGLGFKLENFYTYCRETKFRKIVLIFHSYELIIIFWAAIFIFSLGDIAKSIAIGMTQHLIFDQLNNVKRVKADGRIYFFIFRLLSRFDKERIIKEK